MNERLARSKFNTSDYVIPTAILYLLQSMNQTNRILHQSRNIVCTVYKCYRNEGKRLHLVSWLIDRNTINDCQPTMSQQVVGRLDSRR